MSQKLPVRNFKWIGKDDISKFDEEFIKNYDEDSDQGCILEVDVEYPENIRMSHSDLAFFPERMKINKCTKLTCTIQNKENYVIHIRIYSVESILSNISAGFEEATMHNTA